jgi:hypothetical protein
MKRSFVSCLAALCVAVVLSACSVFGSSPTGDLSGEVDPPVLILKNTMTQPAHYFVVEETTAARLELQFGDYRDWPTIGAGQTVEIPYDQIALYQEGDPSAWVRWETGDRGGSFSVSLR